MIKKVLVIGLFITFGLLTASAIAPYLKMASLSWSISEASKKVPDLLTDQGYEVLGQYQPGENADLYVVVFTSSKLKTLCKKSGEEISISILNPEYLFYAYFRELMEEDSFHSFAMGLPHAEEGEAHFLPIVGESHVAAMPYEMILQGNQATMLYGRYRFALNWPELKMKTFTKKMSSPGDVEDAMKTLVE